MKLIYIAILFLLLAITASAQVKPPTESAMDRFLRYVKIDTQSAEDQSTVPSTKKQCDLANLLASSEFPILFLNNDLEIKRFTAASRRLFNLIPSDLGRPIGDFASSLVPNDLLSAAREV